MSFLTIESAPVHELVDHPLAHLVPEMRPEEYAQLLADVRERGVQDPLHIHEGYTVLDGRHRLRAAREVGLELVPVVEADLAEGESEVVYMMQRALHRRHLTDDQRAVLAVAIKKQLTAEAKTAAGRAGGQASGKARAESNGSGNVPEPFTEGSDSEAPLDPKAVGTWLDNSLPVSIRRLLAILWWVPTYRVKTLVLEKAEKEFGCSGSMAETDFNFLPQIQFAGAKGWKLVDGAVETFGDEDGRRYVITVAGGNISAALATEPEMDAGETESLVLVKAEPLAQPSPELEKPKRDTRREAAQAVGLPPESRKVRDAEQLEKKAPELLPKVASGEITMKEANREIRKRERDERVQKSEERAAIVRATSDTLGKFICIDNTGILAGDWPERVDLVLTDPPYGQSKSTIRHHDRKDITSDFGEWDTLDFSWLLNLKNIMHPEKGQALIFCPVEGIARLKLTLPVGLNYRCTIAWHKTNPGTLHRKGYLSTMEHIVWVTTGQDYYLSEPANAGSLEVHNFLEGPICGGHERLDHPNQKPLWLMMRLLERHAQAGDLVLDPFAGVGSTLAACEERGVRYLGLEMNEDYHRQGMSRLTRCGLTLLQEFATGGLVDEDELADDKLVGAGPEVQDEEEPFVIPDERPDVLNTPDGKRHHIYFQEKAWAARKILREKPDGYMAAGKIALAIERLVGPCSSYVQEEIFPELVRLRVIAQVGRGYSLGEVGRA